MVDCHSHCSCSFDCDEPIENMCAQALKLGLVAYGITDHCEVNRFFSEHHYGSVETAEMHYNFQDDFEKSMKQIEIAKKKFKDLNLLCGVELGQPLFDLKTTERIIHDPRLDYIICSIHEIPPLKDFYYLDYSDLDSNKLLSDYFNHILALTEWGQFNVLAHLTYPLQYLIEYDIKPNLENFKDIIVKIFKNMAEKNIALEINCAKVYEDIYDTMPNLELIKLFYDCGGKYISIGSDAHCADDIASGIKKGIENAQKAGFNGFYYFKNHLPIYIDFSSLNFTS